MTVTLIPPVLGPVDDRVLYEALTEGPSFIVRRHPQRAGRLWHRPRAGYLSLYEWEPDRIRTTWTLWCGSYASSDRCETSDVPPIGDDVCATCEGRAAGAGQIPNAAAYSVRFTPYGTTAPKRCPGSGRTGLWIEHDQGGTLASPAATCLVCGSLERIRYRGGFYTGGPGLRDHAPAAGLLRCPLHAWRNLTRAGDQLACRCGTELTPLAAVAS